MGTVEEQQIREYFESLNEEKRISTVNAVIYGNSEDPKTLPDALKEFPLNSIRVVAQQVYQALQKPHKSVLSTVESGHLEDRLGEIEKNIEAIREGQISDEQLERQLQPFTRNYRRSLATGLATVGVLASLIGGGVGYLFGRNYTDKQVRRVQVQQSQITEDLREEIAIRPTLEKVLQFDGIEVVTYKPVKVSYGTVVQPPTTMNLVDEAELSEKDYIGISSEDGVNAVYGCDRSSAHKFKFIINEDISTIGQINVTWVGGGIDKLGVHPGAHLYIWGQISKSWVEVGSHNTAGTPQNINKSYINTADYINNSDNSLTLLAQTETEVGPDPTTISTDFVKVDVYKTKK